MTGDKRFVYVLRNADRTPSFYVGSHPTSARDSPTIIWDAALTRPRWPWQLHVVIEFSDQGRAMRFERYLKSGSGRAFAKRHFER